MLMEIPFIKKIVAQGLGITPHRPFPKFTRGSGRSRLKRDVRTEKKIIFLSDSFARYLEPETEQAALDILLRCGFDVHVLPILGAGASLLSKGFVEAAKRHAGRVLDALNQVDPAGEATIVGIEPPEIYTLKHDYIDLLPERQDEITRRIPRVWLLDEFLLRCDEFNSLRVVTLGQSSYRRDNFSKKIKFHPHCHQRAEGLAADGLAIGTNATVELLRACGYEVELLDTGCCGMAGTFGYEAEHYELSMKVGELKLFPALRTPTAHSPSGRGTSPKSDVESSHANRSLAVGFGGGWEGVVSTGAACRMQIQQGTGIEAEHSIVMVAKALIAHDLS
jgi:Fe-S oxidoreductase